MPRIEQDTPAPSTPENGENSPHTRIERVVLALARLKPDGSYAYGYVGDYDLLRDSHRDRLQEGEFIPRKMHSIFGEAKRAADGTVVRLRRIAQGQPDEIGERILKIVQASDPRHAKLTVEEAIEMIARENPMGWHKRYNVPVRGSHDRARKPKETSPQQEPKSPSPNRATRWGYQNRHMIRIEYERADIPMAKADSVTSHPLWPKRQLTQTEKYAYAMSLPGNEDKPWHFKDLREVILHINSGTLIRDANGDPLTPRDREQKLDDMTDGARRILDEYFTPLIYKHRDYYDDPASYVGVPELVRNWYNWIKYMPIDNRPPLDDFLARLGNKTLPQETEH